MAVLRCLDLCCGAGGAAEGYRQAGFLVTGIDITRQPNFQAGRFLEYDALQLPRWYLQRFDLIHVSPPCQGYSVQGKGRWEPIAHPQMIHAFRAMLVEVGVPYVIENVPGASRHLDRPVILRGAVFGLGVDRPRLFETTFPVPKPPQTERMSSIGVYGTRPDGRRVSPTQCVADSLEAARAAMGIDWMNWDELTEAIPPAYTEYIGNAFRNPITVTRPCQWCRGQVNGKKTANYCSENCRQRAFQNKRFAISQPVD